MLVNLLMIGLGLSGICYVLTDMGYFGACIAFFTAVSVMVALGWIPC